MLSSGYRIWPVPDSYILFRSAYSKRVPVCGIGVGGLASCISLRNGFGACICGTGSQSRRKGGQCLNRGRGRFNRGDMAGQSMEAWRYGWYLRGCVNVVGRRGATRDNVDVQGGLAPRL